MLQLLPLRASLYLTPSRATQGRHLRGRWFPRFRFCLARRTRHRVHSMFEMCSHRSSDSAKSVLLQRYSPMSMPLSESEGNRSSWSTLTAAGRCGKNRARADPGIYAWTVRAFRANEAICFPMNQDPRKFGLFRNASKTIVHPPGTIIFQEGEVGHSMFAIKRGRVAIKVDGNTVDTLADGEIFGEMALLDHAPRTASVLTLEETELVEIDEPQFYILVRQNPHFALQLMQLLSERLRRADALYRRTQTQ